MRLAEFATRLRRVIGGITQKRWKAPHSYEGAVKHFGGFFVVFMFLRNCGEGRFGSI